MEAFAGALTSYLTMPGIFEQGFLIRVPEAPDYSCACRAPRERKRSSTSQTVMRSYQQMLGIWKDADADFIPALHGSS
jgi:hypothetical protein